MVIFVTCTPGKSYSTGGWELPAWQPLTAISLFGAKTCHVSFTQTLTQSAPKVARERNKISLAPHAPTTESSLNSGGEHPNVGRVGFVQVITGRSTRPKRSLSTAPAHPPGAERISHILAGLLRKHASPCEVKLPCS